MRNDYAASLLGFQDIQSNFAVVAEGFSYWLFEAGLAHNLSLVFIG